MTLGNGMQALVKKLKLLQVGDSAVRRNPLFYADAQRELDRLERASFEERRKWTRARLSELLFPASRSGYGLIVRGGGDIASWPLLTKGQVRGAPAAFSVGSQLFTIKANTGGTSGAPLEIVRSLRSVVFEQVCIDRMMEKVGIDARSARCAVLRTESIKDPNDFKPPYWIFAGGGTRIVLSSTHLNAVTVEHYARALDEFDPDCLLGYPTSLEALCFLLRRAGRRLHIPAALCSSEVLQPRVWHWAVARSPECWAVTATFCSRPRE
jgi:phenylacetate-CoA ligase